MNALSKIITPIEGFQYSVNIAYDIYDKKKIKSYIPSVSALQIIEDILASTDNRSTDRARILTGSYGKGKSHLILYILALLSGQDKSLFSTAINKANKENPNLAKNIQDYLATGRKLLPVIINTNSLDIRSTLLQSLDLALRNAGLSQIMPTTFFDAAINKILSWEKNFPDTFKAFEKVTGRRGKDFIGSLQNYDQSSYDLFVKIYPSLTSGSEFNPIGGSDVIGIYQSVITEIKSRGYNGIFVVYDEFGKFLEGSVDKSSAMDIKLIQDFAEKCNRSGSDQLHIMLISHKSIDNYIGKLSKIKVDAWKAVSNRFKPISLNNDETEIYDMIATVLGRDKELFKQYAENHISQFETLKHIVLKDPAFTGIKMQTLEDLAIRCYPLHPYSLLLLPKISELVAQNERTIFTFLSSVERYSVPYFLRTNDSDFPIIEPDYIYDYFEKLFKGEPYGSDIKKQWQITTTALSKLKEYDNQLAEKIVKTIALIYCVNDFETIPPSWDIICDIYSISYRWAEIESAKEILKKAHLLIELLYKPYVRISEGSGHDVLELIRQEGYKIESSITAVDVFNTYYNINYLYPTQYNDENEIVRYFDFRFIDYSILGRIRNHGLELDTRADGVVFAILAEDDLELEKCLDIIKCNHNKRAVFIIPKTSYNYKEVAVQYQAIMNLKTSYGGKEVELIEELNYILEDRKNLLDAYIENTFFRFEKGNCFVYYDGSAKEIARKAQLSQLLSSIMSDIYFRTPRIINDLINKNQISPTIKSARNKILSAIIAGGYSQNLGLIGNGPELNILRSTLVIPGVFINEADPHFELNCKDEKIRRILLEIKKYILQSTVAGGHSIGELYDILLAPEYGYGLKRGVVPIYIAVVFAQYRNYISILRHGRELPLSASVLCDIDFAPEEYSVILEEWDEKKELYILNLENIFSQYVNIADQSNGSFVYIVKAMRRWYLQLPKYAITTKKFCASDGSMGDLDRATLRFRNALNSSDINPHEFLFVHLPRIFETDDYDESIKILRNSYRYINDTYRNMHVKLADDVKALLKAAKSDRLASVLADFYDNLKETTKEHSFSGKISAFLDIARQPNNDEYKLVEMIARAIFNLRMSDFTDEIMEHYVQDLDSVIEEVKKYDAQLNNTKAALKGYKIIYTDDQGIEVTKQFDATEYTDRGQLLYNDITTALDDFGEAVSSDEKRQILFRILKEIG